MNIEEPKHRLLRYFNYKHLPDHLQEHSKPFHDLAHAMWDNRAGSELFELSEALRKLLEAKDCYVRSMLQ